MLAHEMCLVDQTKSGTMWQRAVQVNRDILASRTFDLSDQDAARFLARFTGDAYASAGHDEIGTIARWDGRILTVVSPRWAAGNLRYDQEKIARMCDEVGIALSFSAA